MSHYCHKCAIYVTHVAAGRVKAMITYETVWKFMMLLETNLLNGWN